MQNQHQCEEPGHAASVLLNSSIPDWIPGLLTASLVFPNEPWLWACEFNKKSFAFVGNTLLHQQMEILDLKITRFHMQGVLFIFCHVNGVQGVRSGLGWVGLANSLSKRSTYLCANFYPQCCPTVQVGCCGSGHSVLHSRWRKKDNLTTLVSSLKSFLEGNVINDSFIPLTSLLYPMGWTRKCNLEPENTAT